MTLAQLFSHWQEVRAGLLATIDQFADDELTFVPFETSWPVGQIMLHIADAEEGWFRNVVTDELAEWPSDFLLARYPTRSAIKALLTSVHSHTETYLASLTLADMDRRVEMPWSEATLSQGWIIWHVLEHEIHHRGELSFALGLLGREGLDV
jgi:uncharacterized damage-inducible protein DinB